MRLTRRDSLHRILDQATRWGGSHFLPEMVIRALRAVLRIVEVPVNYRGRVGESKITGSLAGAVRTGLRMIVLILRCRVPDPPSRRFGEGGARAAGRARRRRPVRSHADRLLHSGRFWRRVAAVGKSHGRRFPTGSTAPGWTTSGATRR
jgi:hypothetical protein